MRLTPAAPVALALVIGLVPHADAAPKKGAGKPTPPACGAKVLPLVLGNSWTYSNVAAPDAGDPQITRIAPTPPKTFTITVTKVEAKGTDTLVTLEEKYQYDGKDTKKPTVIEKTVTSTITCNAKTKFDISPESFLFAGEPGGWYGMKFDTLTRKKETTWKLAKGTIGEADWIEELEGHFVRDATPGTEVKTSPGKVTLERRFMPQEPETIITKLGTYKAEKLLLTTTGRIKLDQPIAPEGKSCRIQKEDGTFQPVDVCEMPGGWTNQLWLVDNVGLVQALNKYSHMYQLTASTLK
ncbi:MAG TPA: hypothetical protein VIU61_03735 [Kofleriaceae bacterium]